MSFSKIMRLLAMVMAGVFLLAAADDAEAAKKKKRGGRRSQTISRAAGISDPRYAALIMDPVTGEVYHQANADGQRYPASLTKMMTLYLLFEALDQKKVSMGTEMEASALAARQPRTNLSLHEGDEVDVETAIKALIVLSANDVAVVVAEKLGGDVDSFAEMMTNKALALGMKNTVFQNPNGLPNSEQHTTARDMAKLGIALKRDFPRYYHYFSTLQFSHNGATYYTHNRVMLRYAGVDGIKTGFIGTSGFNLVTSVVRGGRPLVGVVMGGATGRWRDNRMIELLDQSYQTLSNRGAAHGKLYPENLPLASIGGVKKGMGIDSKFASMAVSLPADGSAIPEEEEGEEGGTNDTLPSANIPADRKSIRKGAPSVFDVSEVASQVEPVAEKSTKAKVVVVTTSVLTSSKKTAVTAPAPSSSPPVNTASPDTAPVVPAPVEKGFEWGIQVGAFSSASLADQAVTKAQQAAARQLVGAQPAVLSPATGAATSVYRARLVHLSQTQAKNACAELLKNKMPCLAFNAGK